jgi:hypothetical protein
MSDTPRTDAKETPIAELLRGVPITERLCIPFQWDKDKRETGHNFIPIGSHAHKAADLIEQLQHDLAATIAALRSANTPIANVTLSGDAEYWKERAEKAEAALAEMKNHSDAATKALGNCYTMARRALRDEPTNGRWLDIKRFCEEAGLKPQILRASFPTEITDGSKVKEPSNES